MIRIATEAEADMPKLKEYRWTCMVPSWVGGALIGTGTANFFVQAAEYRGCFVAVVFAGLSIVLFGMWRLARIHAVNLGILLDEALHIRK